MTTIIAFAGKKQSGKNTACNGIFMLQLLQYGVCRKARIAENGNIMVTDIFGERLPGQEWINLNSDEVNVNGLYDTMRPYVAMYALADPLKEFIVDMFGVDKRCVYGSDDDKNKKCGLKWEDMPGVTTNLRFYRSMLIARDKYNERKDILKYVKSTEEMTVRNLMQFFGTDILRRIDPNIFVKHLLRRIKQDNSQIALISDVRFANEMSAIKEAGGYVIGLMRNSEAGDTHASEQVDFSQCTHTLDNSNLTPTEQVHAIHDLLCEIGCDHLFKRAKLV